MPDTPPQVCHVPLDQAPPSGERDYRLGKASVRVRMLKLIDQDEAARSAEVGVRVRIRGVGLTIRIE